MGKLCNSVSVTCLSLLVVCCSAPPRKTNYERIWLYGSTLLPYPGTSEQLHWSDPQGIDDLYEAVLPDSAPLPTVGPGDSIGFEAKGGTKGDFQFEFVARSETQRKPQTAKAIANILYRHFPEIVRETLPARPGSVSKAWVWEARFGDRQVERDPERARRMYDAVRELRREWYRFDLVGPRWPDGNKYRQGKARLVTFGFVADGKEYCVPIIVEEDYEKWISEPLKAAVVEADPWY